MKLSPRHKRGMIFGVSGANGAVLVTIGLLQILKNDVISGVTFCGMAAVLVLQNVGVPHWTAEDSASDLFGYSWRHHKAIIVFGLAFLPMAFWLGSRASDPYRWVDGFVLAAFGFVVTLALLTHRYRRRERETVDRPRSF
jgi:hypothetical protein